MALGNEVVLIGNYSVDRQSSMQKFAGVLAEGLTSHGFVVRRIHPRPVFNRWPVANGSAQKWLGYLDKFLLFPFDLRRQIGKPSALAETRRKIVHVCDHSNSLYTRYLGCLPHLVTCHDMIAVRQATNDLPSPHVGWTGRQLQAMIVRGLRRAHWVACDSESTRRDLQIATGRSARTETILCQLNYPYRRMSRESASAVLKNQVSAWSGPRVLHVGNNSWYKNRDGVLRIFADAKRSVGPSAPSLLVVGRDFTAAQQTFISAHGLGGCVHRVADLSPSELEAAYSLADAFLFPSHYEGFGWPPIEAQACGCPVVAGNGGSLAEVLGDSARVADSRDEVRLAGHLSALLSDERLRADIVARGSQNVLRFQPPRMVKGYVDLYRRILAESAGQPTRN